ncbi:hypothetical protein [Enterococcus sp. ZJ1668]|uniref:hypothetical protein n=1 Tax=Enterococcus sp. ZJ1668 TaxID=2709402 RepID=UPI0013ED313D|nr:hypothetical protein [Enterococcus sp. ZJ1668]
MENQLPKAVKAENLANILRVKYENGEVRYLKTHWVGEVTDAFRFGKNGKGKRKNLLALSRNMWIGSEVKLEDDGTVILNGKDRYTPEELWYEGKKSIPEL